MKFAIGILKPCNIVQPQQCVPITSCHLAAPEKLISTSNINVRANNKNNSLRSNSIKCFNRLRGGKLRDKWMECQGIKNWEGLLDPLDDDLRGEILRYGEFVEAAYRSFDFEPSSPSYAMCQYPIDSMLTRCGFGQTGYKVTSSLHATCSVNVPHWAERIPQPHWVSTQSSWIGYVAVCDDKDEITRLGRRDVVIAYRGTITCLEWLENLRATLSCLPNDMAPQNCEPMVQKGFLSLYTSGTKTHPSLRDTVRHEISQILKKYKDEPLSVTITGHSLGAALATLTAYDITNTFKHAPLVTVVSFGGPRVGNKTFRSQLEEKGTKVLRIVNSDDLVTKVPGFVIRNDDMEKGDHVQVAAGLPGWIQRRVEDTQWVYAEVGKELRLSSKDCPHLTNGDVAKCHDLKTYLHLVNNFVSSTCPFRATAKRVLRKSQHDQKQLLLR